MTRWIVSTARVNEREQFHLKSAQCRTYFRARCSVNQARSCCDVMINQSNSLCFAIPRSQADDVERVGLRHHWSCRHCTGLTFQRSARSSKQRDLGRCQNREGQSVFPSEHLKANGGLKIWCTAVPSSGTYPYCAGQDNCEPGETCHEYVCRDSTTFSPTHSVCCRIT